MAFGDLLPTSGNRYAIEFRGTLFAIGSDYWRKVSKLEGVGNSRTEAHDTPYNVGPGSYTGRTKITEKTIAWSMNPGSVKHTIAEAEIAIGELFQLWRPDGEEQLGIYLPGRGQIYLVGHPGDLDITRKAIVHGFAEADLDFIATDPEEYVL